MPPFFIKCNEVKGNFKFETFVGEVLNEIHQLIELDEFDLIRPKSKRLSEFLHTRLRRLADCFLESKLEVSQGGFGEDKALSFELSHGLHVDREHDRRRNLVEVDTWEF